MKCPTAEEILLARHAEVDPRRQREISRHVARCPHCRREDAALRQASAAFARRFGGGSGRSFGPARQAAQMLTPATLLLTILVALLVTIAAIRVTGAIHQNFLPLPPADGTVDDCETQMPVVGTTPAARATSITLTRH